MPPKRKAAVTKGKENEVPDPSIKHKTQKASMKDDSGSSDNDDDEPNQQDEIEKFQSLIVKAFDRMVNEPERVTSQIRLICRIYFNLSEEQDPEVAMQLNEAVFRLSAQIFLLNEKSEAFQTLNSLMPRIWRAMAAEMFDHCQLVEGWSEEQFKERIVALQEQATTLTFRFLAREMNVGSKAVKILAMKLLHRFVHDLHTKFELSDKDGLTITTALIPRLLDKQLEVKKQALSICSPFLFSAHMYHTIRYLAVSDPSEEIRRSALFLLYRPSFYAEYRSKPQLQAIDALIFIARMQDESPLIRSTLLQLFEEKELRIVAVPHQGNVAKPKHQETDFRSVNNHNVYSTYGTLFTCDYRNRSTSKLNYRQKLWVIKQGLTDPDQRIVWQTMNIVTKLFCSRNFSLIDFIYYLSCGQSEAPHISDPSNLSQEQQEGLRSLKDTLLLADNSAYQHNNPNNHKIWTSTISQLTTSLNRSGSEAGSSGFIDPQVFTIGASGGGEGKGAVVNDPLSFFNSAASSGATLNSSIYEDLSIVFSYIVCSYTWRHAIDQGDDRTDYEYYKRKRTMPRFGTKVAVVDNNNNTGGQNSGHNSQHEDDLAPGDGDDEDLLDQLMASSGKKNVSFKNGGSAAAATAVAADANDEDPENDAKGSKKGKNAKNATKSSADSTPADNDQDASTTASASAAGSKQSDLSPLAATIDINAIKLNSRQVVLEIPAFTRMLKHTAFHFQHTLFSVHLQEYHQALAEYNQIMALRQEGNEEALALDVEEPQAPNEPLFLDLFPDETQFDPNCPLLTSGLCLFWYLLLSSLSGQTNSTFVEALKSYQIQYQEQEQIKNQLLTEQTGHKNGKNGRISRLKSLPIIDLAAVQSSLPRLSCPGYSSPEKAVELMDTRFLQELVPETSTMLALIPLLDQFSQSSLSLHILLLTYHIDVKQTTYHDLRGFYEQFQGFISSPEFQNSLLPLVFLNIRSLQPIIVIRYYQHVDHINTARYEYQLQHPAEEEIDFDQIEHLALPEQAPTYVQIMTDLAIQFLDTIVSLETTAAQPLHPFRHHFNKNLTLPLKTTHNKSKSRSQTGIESDHEDHNNPAHGFGSGSASMSVSESENHGETDLSAFDQAEEGKFTPQSIRHQYRTQLLILQSHYNEIRHSDHGGQDEEQQMGMGMGIGAGSGDKARRLEKIAKRAAFIKKEYNKFRNHYYLYVGHVEFLLKRLLIIVLDFVTNCPVITQPAINETGDAESDAEISLKMTLFFSLKICCTEDIMSFILNTIIYPILGWKKYDSVTSREVFGDNGEVVEVVTETNKIWLDIDFLSVDVNLLLLQILTQTALLSTSNIHITIVLQYLLLFTTIAAKDSNGITAENQDNQDLVTFRSYNTQPCQSLGYHPHLNGIIDILDGQGFYSTRTEGLGGRIHAGYNVGDGNDRLRSKFFDITSQRGFGHFFVHPVLQLHAIKGITDILFAFVNLVPITSHQHSYDRLDKGWEMRYQPRKTILGLNTNDELPSDVMFHQFQNFQSPQNGPNTPHTPNTHLPLSIPVELVMLCHETLLGYGQSYVDSYNDISLNYKLGVQRWAFLEIEQAIGNIYRSLTKFHYGHDRHAHYANRLATGKVTRVGGDGKKQIVEGRGGGNKMGQNGQNGHKKGPQNGNEVNQFDIETDSENEADGDADDFSDCDLEEELGRLHDAQMSGTEEATLTKAVLDSLKATRDPHRKPASSIRETYSTTQALLFGRLVAGLHQIHQFVEVFQTVAGNNNNNNSNVNENQKDQNAFPPRLPSILTGDLVCISDLSYEPSHSLQYGPMSAFDNLSIDGMSTPLKDLRQSYDLETLRRISNIFSSLSEQQTFIQAPSSAHGDGSDHKGPNRASLQPILVQEQVLDLFLHEDIFLLFKSVQPVQISAEDRRSGKSLTGNAVQDKAIRRATPFELVPYSNYNNPFLILGCLQDCLVHDDFFHSLASGAQIADGDQGAGYRDWFQTLCADKHLRFQNESKWSRKQAYSSLYHVPLTSAHLNLYTNTYVSILYQSIQSTAIFSLCKLLFFDRVPYVLSRQYLSLLTIATITSRVKTQEGSSSGPGSNAGAGSLAPEVGASTGKRFGSGGKRVFGDGAGVHSTTATSSFQQDLYNLLQLFFNCYVKLNFNTVNLITPHNQHYTYTLHLYQNIAKKIAFKKWQKGADLFAELDQENNDHAQNHDRTSTPRPKKSLDEIEAEISTRQTVSIDSIVFGFQPYDFQNAEGKKGHLKNETHGQNENNDPSASDENYYPPTLLSVSSLPTLHHIKDNLPLRQYLWDSIPAQEQAIFKQLFHSSHFASDWSLSSGVSVCDHLSLLSSSAPTIITDILIQFSKQQALSLISHYITFTTLLLSPQALSHSTSSFNPLAATNSNLPVDFSILKPTSNEMINAATQHGVLNPLSSSVTPLSKFCLDLLSILTNAPIFDQHFLSTMAIIKAVVAAVSDWQLLPRDFYPIFHAHGDRHGTQAPTHPDDIVSNDLYPELYLDLDPKGPENNNNNNNNHRTAASILQNKPLLEHTVSSPSRRAVIGFYLILSQTIELFAFLKRHAISLPSLPTDSKSKLKPKRGAVGAGASSSSGTGANGKDKDLVAQKKLIDFYQSLLNDVKEFASKLIYFISLTRASSDKKPAPVSKANAKKAAAAKKTAKAVGARKGTRRGAKNIQNEDENDDKNDSETDPETVPNPDNETNSDSDSESSSHSHSQSQLINYNDPLVGLLNRSIVKRLTVNSISRYCAALFPSPLSFDVFHLNQLVHDHDRDSSYTIDALLAKKLTLDSLTTITTTSGHQQGQHSQTSSQIAQNSLAGGPAVLVDNDIEDFVNALSDQRRQVIGNTISLVPKAVWKRHFLTLGPLSALSASNQSDLDRVRRQRKQSVGSGSEEDEGDEGEEGEEEEEQGENGGSNPSKFSKRYIKPTGKTPRKATKTPRKKLGSVMESGHASDHDEGFVMDEDSDVDVAGGSHDNDDDSDVVEVKPTAKAAKATVKVTKAAPKGSTGTRTTSARKVSKRMSSSDDDDDDKQNERNIDEDETEHEDEEEKEEIAPRTSRTTGRSSTKPTKSGAKKNSSKTSAQSTR